MHHAQPPSAVVRLAHLLRPFRPTDYSTATTQLKPVFGKTKLPAGIDNAAGNGGRGEERRPTRCPTRRRPHRKK